MSANSIPKLLYLLPSKGKEVDILAFKSARCPNCSGELSLDPTMDKGFCMHCGSNIVVEEAIKKVKVDGLASVQNLLDMAENMKRYGKYREAYNYYTKALEIDPKYYKTIYKRSLLVASRLGHDEFDEEEFFTGIELSLEYAPNDKKEAFKKEIGEDISRLFADNHEVTNDLEERYRRASVNLRIRREHYGADPSRYIKMSESRIIKALEMASTMNHKTEYNNLKRTIQFYPYNYLPVTSCLKDSRDNKNDLTEIIEMAEEKYKEYDPYYLSWSELESPIKDREKRIQQEKKEKELERQKALEEKERVLEEKRKEKEKKTVLQSWLLFIAVILMWLFILRGC